MSNDAITDEAYTRSIDLLHEAATPYGFVASSVFDHYRAIWGRDAAITALGALTTDDDVLVSTAVATLKTLSGSQTGVGQVPAVVHPETGGVDFGEGGVVDVTAWYVILADAVVARTGDGSLAATLWPGVVRAIRWLKGQDITGTGLLSCAPATDWMDSSLVRSGRTLHLNTLYHWTALAARRLGAVLGVDPPADPYDIAARVNLLFWPQDDQEIASLEEGGGFGDSAIADSYRAATLTNRTHYLSHVVHSLFDENCDVLANLLTVCTGLADQARAGLILDMLSRSGAARPFPTKSWLYPVSAAHMLLDEEAAHIHSRWRNPPWCYHNAGVWPYIGGFHVLALVKLGRDQEADGVLEGVARANRVGEAGEWRSHEWLHGQTGEPRGAARQAWNAGTYVLAWNARHRRALVESVLVEL